MHVFYKITNFYNYTYLFGNCKHSLDTIYLYIFTLIERIYNSKMVDNLYQLIKLSMCTFIKMFWEHWFDRFTLKSNQQFVSAMNYQLFYNEEPLINTSVYSFTTFCILGYTIFVFSRCFIHINWKEYIEVNTFYLTELHVLLFICVITCAI